MSRGPGRAQQAVLADVRKYRSTIGAVVAWENDLTSDTTHRAMRTLTKQGKIKSERHGPTGDQVVFVWSRDEDRPTGFKSRLDAIWKDYENRGRIDAGGIDS